MAPDDACLEARFDRLQECLVGQAEELTSYSERPHTVVVIPSLTLDRRQLEKIRGISYYEERMLYLLLLLRQPRSRVVLVTSQLVDTRTIDYVLALLPRPEMRSARERLTVLSTNDWSPRPLSEKVLERPWLVERIRSHIPDPTRAHMITFNMTRIEMRLALALGIPAVGNPPRLAGWGTKSGARKAFREAGIPLPEGIEDLSGPDDVPAAIEEVWSRVPTGRRIVVKLNEGFSGEGNAILDLGPLARVAPGRASRPKRLEAIERALPNLEFQQEAEDWGSFGEQLSARGGVVEAFLEGEPKQSPSAQLKVDVLGRLSLLSTHDQILGGRHDQVFLGCRFPADASYRMALQDQARRVGEVLAAKGVRGRFSVDFVAIPRGNDYEVYAIEVNLRLGGTTHPFASMDYLVQGRYDQETGLYLAPDGRPRCYVASDNVEEPWLRGLLPADLHTIIESEGLGFDHQTRTGSIFHMLGSASQFGKVGYTCVADDCGNAMLTFESVRERLREAAGVPRIPWVAEGAAAT